MGSGKTVDLNLLFVGLRLDNMNILYGQMKKSIISYFALYFVVSQFRKHAICVDVDRNISNGPIGKLQS